MKNSFISSVVKRFKTRTLINGLKIVAYKDSSSPEVLMQVAYNVGSANETSKTRGMAHFVEHMIFKGTQKLSESDLDAIARKYGAQYNAFTSQDKTCFFFEVDSSNWKQILPILADCMSNARFDQEHLASEIKAVIQELNMYKDDVSSVVFEAACAKLFPADHPYHFPIIGFLSSLAQLRSKDLFEFYKQNYGANNATLYIAGDIDLDDALDFGQKTFESVSPIAQEKISAIVVPAFSRNLTFSQTVIYSDVKAPMQSFFWRIPSMYQPLLEECSGAVNSCFSRGLASRLYKKLVNKSLAATDVSGAVHSMALGGLYQINVSTYDQTTLARCQLIIKKEFANPKLKSGELKKFIQKELFDFYQAIESTQEVVNKLVFSPFESPAQTFDYQGRLKSLTLEMVEDFIAQNFNPDLTNSVLVLPFKDESQRLAWIKNTNFEHEQEAETMACFNRSAPIEAARFVNQLPSPKPLAFDFPKPDFSKVLTNGIELVFKHRDSVPTVHLSMGFKNDEFLAHSRQGVLFNLATNCLVEENQTMTQAQILDGFEKVGADFSFNKTAFYMACNSSSFLKVFKHFLTVISKPLFSSQEVKKLSTIIIDNINRESDELNSISSRAVFCNLFSEHEFNWTFKEAIELMQNSNPEMVKEVYFKNFQPSNLVFVIVGDLSLASIEGIERELEKIESQGSSRSASLLAKASVDFNPKESIHIQALKDQCLVTFARPSEYNIKSLEIVAISLLNTIAFKSLGSRLYQLRERYGLFYSSSGGFASGLELANGIDRIKVLISEQNISQTIDLINQMLEELCHNGITENELLQAKQICQKHLVESYSSNSSMAESFLNVSTKGLGFNFHQEFYGKIVKLTLDDVNFMAKKLCKSLSSFKQIIVGK